MKDQDYDIYSKLCPARAVLTRIADKWALLILDHLRHAPARFNGLHRAIEGVSHKMLSQTLKKLERDGLLAREVFATVPVTVEYRLTDLGLALAQRVDVFAHWAEANMAQITAAQAEFDARGAAE